MNRRDFFKYSLATGVALALGGGLTRPARADGSPKNLLLICWDGVGINQLNRLWPDLPNFQDFLCRACFCPVPIVGKTNTLTGHSKILTGAVEYQTGVAGNCNLKQFPEVENFDDLKKFSPGFGQYMKLNFWLSYIRKEWSIFHPLKTALGFTTGWVTTKGHLLGETHYGKSPFAQIVETSDFWATFCPGGEEGDDYLFLARDKALEFLSTTPAPWALFYHMGNPDAYGHEHGEASERYSHEILRCDAVLGEVLGRLDLTQTEVVLFTDHGFNVGTDHHLNAPDGWMATTLPIHPAYHAQAGQRAWAAQIDLYPTVMAYYGLPLPGVPVRQGKSLI